MKHSWPEITQDFKFKCTLCGECCRGNMNVFLNLYDLYKLSNFAGYTKSDDLFKNRIVDLVVGQNQITVPKIRFKRSPTVFCPFLENELSDDNNLFGRCRLHPLDKPLICKLSPIARQIDLPSGKIKYLLVEPAPGCPGMGKPEKNALSSIINNLDDELEFEKRFYILLDSIRSRKTDPFLKEKMLYYFSTDIPFEKTLSHLENQFS